MKIAIDISQIVYGTGVSNYTADLVRHLLKIDKRNQYILFGASLRQRNKLYEFKKSLGTYENVTFKFRFLPPTLFELLANRLRILSVENLIGQEVDVFHSSDWTQPKVNSKHTKKVTTIHDMTIYLFQSSFDPKIIKTQKARLVKVKKEVDLVIADSEATKEDIVKFLEIPEEKVRVVYLGVSDEFRPADDEIINAVLQKYKIKKPFILSIGTQEPRKNIQKLIDAYEKIKQEYPDFSLVLVGKQGWGEGFRSTEGVNWTGYIPKEDLVAVYSGSRVFVYPSLYEGFGLPILEAMACGVPVVTSNSSSMAEIAKDVAILVDPRSETQLEKAIKMVINLTLDDYQKMVRASLNCSRKFTWTKTAKETLKIYREVYRFTDEDNKKNENRT